MTHITSPITSLPHRALVAITGPDWAPFLKGLCTADIDTLVLESAQGRFHNLHYGAFLRPQGKMICDCILQAVAPEQVWLDVPRTERDDLVARLNMYRLRAKVTIEPLDNPVHVAFDRDLPDGFLPDPRSDIVGAVFGFSYTPQAADNGPPAQQRHAWQAFRFRHGVSDPGQDFARDDLYPIDANLDLLGGIDFHKGCFVGQELTSRMKRRGQIKNRILPLRHDGLLTGGAEILDGERKIGDVLATTEGVSLGVIRLDRLSGLAAVAGGTPVTIIVPEWLAASVPVSA